MGCEVEYTDEFKAWWDRRPPADQRAVERIVDMLGVKGVGLRYPRSSDVLGSRHGHMRELRVGTHPPIRIFYAFDPRRTAILLLGEHKRHPERFYRDHVARADAIYDEHLQEIQREARQEGDDTEGERTPWRDTIRGKS
jgi:hypothetical protein